MRELQLLMLISAMTVAEVSTASPFAGTWKQNRDKSQFDPAAGVLTITANEQGMEYAGAGGPSMAAHSIIASALDAAALLAIHSE